MKRLSTALLAVGLVASGSAFAQSGYYPPAAGYDRYQQDGAQYDYARVVRVDPVLDGRYGNTPVAGQGQRCYETTTAGAYPGNGGYRDAYGNNTYNDPYRNNGYNDPYGHPQAGNPMARNMATVVGGIAGAVLGSKVGGGTGAYAATAIGSMVGGMAGRQIYEQTQRDRYPRQGVVRVCDPEPVTSGYGSYGTYRTGTARASAYDVTYEYNGRRYTRRMDYHPGDRVRVRVDVSPQ
jgi:hypothetical protein